MQLQELHNCINSAYFVTIAQNFTLWQDSTLLILPQSKFSTL